MTARALNPAKWPSGPVVLAVGGTGGHVFPAEALAERLMARGRTLAIIADNRAQFGDAVSDSVPIYRITASGFGGGLRTKLLGLLRLARGLIQSWRILGELRPALVVGFGGYPSVPTVLAASLRRIPSLLHEQNAVLGRANRLLAPRARAIATSFEQVSNLPARTKVSHTGNPVRAAFGHIGEQAYSAPAKDGALSVLVLGGSLGARSLSDIVPAAIAELSPSDRARLVIVQQSRIDDQPRAHAAYQALGLEVELSPFFNDVARRIENAHLVISRAGASTIAELTAAGRPAILIPYPHAMDDHQTANARALTAANAGWLLAEGDDVASLVAAKLRSFLATPDILTQSAAAALALGQPCASDRLADLAESLIVTGTPSAGLPAEEAA